MTGSPAFPSLPSRALSLSLAALLLAACASEQPRPRVPSTTKTQPSKPQKKPWKPLGPYTPGGLYAPGVSDGAPDVPPDIASLPEPVPHPEPLARYGNRSPYVVLGRSYTVLPSAAGYDERGMASWYGTKFDGRVTSSLEPYDLTQFTAAHRTLPLPSYARVTNLENGRSVIVRINDRGPFHDGRLIDLSYAAAIKLGVNVHGTAMVEVKGIDTGKPADAQPDEATASIRPPPRPAPAEAKKAGAKPTLSPTVSAPAANVAVLDADASPRPGAAAATNPKNSAPSAADAGGASTTKRPAPPTTPATAMAATSPSTQPQGEPPASATASPAAPTTTSAPSPPTPPPTATSSPTPAAISAASAREDRDAAAVGAIPKPTPLIGRPSIEPSTIGFLQVASYGDRANAERTLKRLQQAGIAHAELVAVQVADQQLWRVHIGPMRADEAATVAAHMQSLGFGSPPFFKQ